MSCVFSPENWQKKIKLIKNEAGKKLMIQTKRFSFDTVIEPWKKTGIIDTPETDMHPY